MTYRQVQTVLASALGLLGLLVTFGWFATIEPLKSLVPGLSTMKLNAAFCFVLVGLGLGVAEHRRLSAVAVSSGAAAALIGLLTLAEYLFRTNFGIDELLVEDHGVLTGSGHPGRMSPLTALAWMGLGTSIILLSKGRSRLALATAHVCGSFVGFIAFIAAAGYAFGSEAFWGIGFYTAMAVHTAVGLMLATAAVLMTRPYEGWLSGLTDAPAARRLLLRLLPLALGAPFFLGLVLLLGSGAGAYNSAFAFALFVPAMTLALALVSLTLTKRLRTEELALRENDARLSALTNHLPGGMVYQISTGADGLDRNFIYVSQSHEALTGIPASAVMADPTIPYQLIHPDDRPMLGAAEARAIETREPFDVEARFRRGDGELRWCRIISAPREQPDGTLIWDGIQLDITAQKQTEQALRDSEEHLGTALAIARLGTFEWDLETDEVIVDARARQLFGFQAEGPITAADVFACIHPDDLERVEQEVRDARERCVRLETEYRILLADGVERTVISLSDAVPAADGRAGRMIGVFGDMTDRRRLEQDLQRLNEDLERRVQERTAELSQVHEQLRQSQKLEAMGQLTGGVAHDFNNLLTPILGSLDMLQRRSVGSERDQRLIGAALESAERAKTLVQRLLAFARRQPLRPGAVRVDAIIHSMADLIASTSGPKIQVKVDVPDDLPPANADANQLEMAILNLAVNARDAMPDGGSLSISAAAEAVGAQSPDGLVPGRYVRVSISDTGVGMDAETLQRAVEPFFSTKGIGHGTGLGLSMVHGLASQLGGAVRMTSRPGLGTTVDLLLPESLQRPASKSAESEATGARGAGRVVLVDDEPAARASTAEMLVDMGYEVVEFENAPDALAWLKRNQASYVVTDHLMPGISGTEMARTIAADSPDLPILIVSGYADIDTISPDFPRLSKPFRQAELAACMAELGS